MYKCILCTFLPDVLTVFVMSLPCVMFNYYNVLFNGYIIDTYTTKRYKIFSKILLFAINARSWLMA